MRARQRSWPWFVVPFIVVLGIWAIAWWGMVHYISNWQIRGTFGDMFGFMNSLFSGLAFAAFFYALHLQRMELKGSERSQRESQEALNKQQHALTLQIDELEKSRGARVLVFLFEFLHRPDARNARRSLIQVLERKDFQDWTEGDKNVGAEVCASYNIAGILVRENLLKPAILLEDYGESIKRCFLICQPLINEYRREMGSQRYAGDFERLFAEVTGQVVLPTMLGHPDKG